MGQGEKKMLQEDLNFLQVVSIVTSRFGCTIDSIDVEGRTVSITCPGGKEEEVECATAIGDIIEGKSQHTTIWALP
jgi:hypothetical protein